MVGTVLCSPQKSQQVINCNMTPKHGFEELLVLCCTESQLTHLTLWIDLLPSHDFITSHPDVEITGLLIVLQTFQVLTTFHYVVKKHTKYNH
jgi:hypothetical protein